MINLGMGVDGGQVWAQKLLSETKDIRSRENVPVLAHALTCSLNTGMYHINIS